MNGSSQNSTHYVKDILHGLRHLPHIRLSYLRKVFSLMGRREKIAILILAALAVGSLLWSASVFYYSHTSPAPAFGGTYIEGMVGQPTYINPLLSHQETDSALIRLVYSGLYKLDGHGQLVPDLAEKLPEISEDQKQYTIELKKNVTWHNDRPFTADDILFTLQTLKDQNFRSPLRGQWQYTSVEKLSEYSVRFTTKDVSGPFIYNLTLPILPKSVWGRIDAQNFTLSQNNLEAIGTGPYQIREIKKLASGKIQEITLDSFSAYYGGEPNIRRLIIKYYDSDEDLLNAMHSKDIQGFGFVAGDSDLYLDRKREDMATYPAALPNYQTVFFNLNHKILAETNVRRALLLATDRRAIIEEVFRNNAQVPVSPFVFASQKEQLKSEAEPNIEEAKRLLDNAGWLVNPATSVRTKKGQALSFSLMSNDAVSNSKAAEMLANQWRALNIEVSLKIIPTKQLTDENIRPRNFDVLLFLQKFGPDPDPFVFWHSSQSRDPGLNLTTFENPAADKLITEARSTTNTQVRQQKYLEFNNLMQDLIPAFFLTQEEYVYAVDKNVKNVHLNNLFEPSQRFNFIPSWYIEEKRVW